MSLQEITDLYNREIPKLFQTRMSWGDWGYSWISPSSWKESIWNNLKRLSGNPPTDTNGWLYSFLGFKTHLGIPTTPYPRTSFEAALNEMFGSTETSDVQFHGCMAGAQHILVDMLPTAMGARAWALRNVRGNLQQTFKQ